MDSPTRKAKAVAMRPLAGSCGVWPLVCGPRIMWNRAVASAARMATKAKETMNFMRWIIQ